MKFNKKKAFGGVASTLIMFIAIIMVTTGIVISFMKYVDNAEDSMAVKNDFLTKKLETELGIINIVYDNPKKQTTIYLKNLGKTKLKSELLVIFLDEQYKQDLKLYQAENTSQELYFLDVQEIGIITINQTLNSGSHEVKIISEYGIGDTQGFNI